MICLIKRYVHNVNKAEAIMKVELLPVLYIWNTSVKAFV